MATAEQLKALIESFTKGDDSRFRSVALQIAARSSKQGKTKLAEELKALLDQAPRVHHGPVVPIARPSKDLAGLLSASYPETQLSEMVLTPELRGDLQRVVTEYRQRDRLRAHGLRPKQRLLLVGPPGCGKTMTASALAGECHLPLMLVELHSLITKYMGETAAKLHLVFQAMEKTAGVYLFDEFDAIGAVRTAGNDVGEIRRILNSFLQFLEHTKSDSIVVAATNLLSLLDEALFRRFDVVLHYELPDQAAIQALIENRLALFDVRSVDWRETLSKGAGLSHADVVGAAEEAAKNAVLNGSDRIASGDLASELTRRRAFRARPERGVVEAIREALAEGERSGIAEDSSLEGVLAEFRSSRAR